MSAHQQTISRKIKHNGATLYLLPNDGASGTKQDGSDLSNIFEDPTALAGPTQTRVGYHAVSSLVKVYGTETLPGAWVLPYVNLNEEALVLPPRRTAVGARAYSGLTQGTAHIELMTPIDETRDRGITLAFSLDLRRTLVAEVDYQRIANNNNGYDLVPIAAPAYHQATNREISVGYGLLAHNYCAAPLSDFVTIGQDPK
jgi:hypothetical protein